MTNAERQVMQEKILNADDELMQLILLTVVRWFNKRALGNPFNYNRAFEWLQAQYLGLNLSKVGGGSDAYDENGITAEFKATQYKGLGKNNSPLQHSWAYNGTSYFSDLDEQIDYCTAKIMRDQNHFYSVIDYDTGEFVTTLKAPNETVLEILLPKFINSWKKSPTSKDPRIGGSVTTKDLIGKDYEKLVH